jgi:hypothetical protein
MSAKGVSTITRSHPVNHQLRLDIQHLALRRTTAPRASTSLSRTDVVPDKAAWGLVKWCGWHGMQGVRGSNPLSSTTGQRPHPASTGSESPASGSRSAAICAACPIQSSSAVGGTPDDHPSHSTCQERGAQPWPSACQRHRLRWRRSTPGTRGAGRRGVRRAPAATTGSRNRRSARQCRVACVGFLMIPKML